MKPGDYGAHFLLAPIVSGAVLGALFVTVASRRSRREEAQLLAIGLVIAALIYVVLAIFGADLTWLLYEAAGLLLFGAFAWLGVRASPAWLALGWTAHVAWDVGLHLDRSQAIVPDWYPLLCVGFDLLVAGFVLGSMLPWRAVNSTAA
jgi:hypothetical protein